MSTVRDVAPAPGSVPTTECANCGATVPAGAFCGNCGADLVRPDRHPWLRPRVFAVAPRERVGTPMITSSLFPHLAQPSRNPFRLALLLLLVVLVAGSLLRTLGPLVSAESLGVPLLFVLYLWQCKLHRDLAVDTLVGTALIGTVLGVSWALLTGGLVARSYGIPMAAGFVVLERLLSVGLIISLGAALLMVVPAVVMRLFRSATREALDGFVIGALGALSFTAAAAITRLAPQFVSGFTENSSRSRLLLESVLHGAAVPLTAAAAGGLIGITLWFRPGHRAGEHPTRVRVVLGLFMLLVAGIYSAIWVIDASRLPKIEQLVLHIAITVIALIALRVGIQLALLHEDPDRCSRRPLLCVRCERVVPDMPFCPACGAAARAAPRWSRRLRRESVPVRDDAH